MILNNFSFRALLPRLPAEALSVLGIFQRQTDAFPFFPIFLTTSPTSPGALLSTLWLQEE